MFLETLKRRNIHFINVAAQLHQEGKIPSNCYVLDLDTIEENSRIINQEAAKHNMKVFAMSKQIGRNPDALDAIKKGGIKSFVAVDIQGARSIKRANHKIGHIGHLVQIAEADIKKAVDMEPEYWTCFNMEKVNKISKYSIKKQKVLVRIYADGDTFYMGHQGGFPLEKIEETAKAINNIENIEFAGITSFPALLLDNDTKKVIKTPNLTTLKKAAYKLRDAGWKNVELNAPGTTSSIVIPVLAEAGATQIEPGHGLTGSTPLHALEELPEKPALLYISEISHFYNGKAFCFGGGFYIDPVFPPYPVKCLIGKDSDTLLQTSIEFPAYNAIDYYGIIKPEKNQNIRIGDTVIMGFRAQVFVTRGYITGITGISTGNPIVKGITTASGRRI